MKARPDAESNGTALDAARHIPDCRGASNCLYFLFDHIGPRWQIGPTRGRWVPCQSSLGNVRRLAVHHRYTHGLRRTAVARVTSNSSFTLKLARINGEHHLDHSAGGLLRLFVVLIEGIANMAEVALDAQRCRYELHRRN